MRMQRNNSMPISPHLSNIFNSTTSALDFLTRACSSTVLDTATCMFFSVSMNWYISFLERAAAVVWCSDVGIPCSLSASFDTRSSIGALIRNDADDGGRLAEYGWIDGV